MARRWLQSRVTRSQSHPEYLPPWIVLVSVCAVLWVMRLVSSHPSSVCFWEQIRTSVRLLPRLGLGVTPQPPPRTAAQVPRVPCRISGSCTKRVTGDARSSPGSASGTDPAAGGSSGAVPLLMQTDNPPAERLAEPELPSTQAQLGNVKMQGEELMLRLELTPILWVYFISSSLMLA